MSVSDVVIADRMSDANQVRLLGTTNLEVSWEMNRAGALTFDVPLLDLIRRYGITNPIALKSKWVHYEHPTAGHWGGIITSVSPGNGIVSIGAESWAAALRGVGTRVWGGSQYGAVTMLMQQIDATRHLTGVTRGTVDTGGGGDVVIRDEPLDPGTDIYDSYLPAVLERWQAERGWKAGLQAAGWNVDPVSRQLSFDSTYGTDRSSTVWIHAGRHVVGTDIGDDLTDVVNTVFYVGQVNYRWTETKPGKKGKGKKRKRQITHVGVKDASKIGVNMASVAQWGERAQQLSEDFPSEQAMQQAANNRVQYLGLDTQNVSVDTADVDGIWSRFREGDLVTLALGFDGLIGKAAIYSRALSLTTGVMTLGCVATLGPVQ